MARVHSLFRISGKLGGLIFYQTSKGSFVKEAPRRDKRKWQEAPEYAAQRARASEFGHVSRVAGQWTRAMKDMLEGVYPRDLHARVRALCQDLIRLDDHDPGERRVAMGLLNTEAACQILHQWRSQRRDLLPESILNRTGICPSTLAVHLPPIAGSRLWNRPTGATAVQFRVHWGFILPETDEMVAVSAKGPVRPLDEPHPRPLVLAPGPAICSEDLAIIFVEVRFLGHGAQSTSNDPAILASQLKVLHLTHLADDQDHRQPIRQNPDLYHPN
ncbi:MAG: hypothetical protein R2787_08690 [Saprospiraceae bacterium]